MSIDTITPPRKRGRRKPRIVVDFAKSDADITPDADHAPSTEERPAPKRYIALPAWGFAEGKCFQMIEDPELLVGVLPAIAPHLEAACERSRGRYNLVWAASGLLNGNFKAWVLMTGAEVDATFMTYTETYPTGLQVVQILLAAGKLSRADARDCLSCIRELTRECGMDEVEFHGRNGWERYLDLPRTGAFFMVSA